MLVPLFASTIFLTSALLFGLEPLVVKGLLPVLGGGAAVWLTAVAFFQIALFAGYLYAHVAPAALGLRRHAWVHVAALAGVALVFPLGAPAGWAVPAHRPGPWLFGALAATVGPAFVLLAATAPLVQRWLAAAEHRRARDPYFLYAASNAGSLGALAAYPVLIEPLLGLARQRRGWMAGLYLAVVLLAACAAAIWRRGRDPAPGPAPEPAPPPTARTRARWLALSAVPSSLLLSVTSYVTTDVVALPLLWVLPLAIYLVTFVIAFARRGRWPPARAVRLQPFLLLPIAAEMFLRTDAAAWVLIPLHGACFFVTALACHQSLAASRPAAARATEFYLYVAAGGALGGLFNALVAPALFPGLYEYPLGLVAAALLRPAPPPDPDPRRQRRARLLDVGLPAAVAALLLGGVPAARVLHAAAGQLGGLVAILVLLGGAGAAVYAFRDRPLRFGLGLAAVMAAGATYSLGALRPLHTARSFYGAHRVLLEPPARHLLNHGNTTHGAQDVSDPAHRREPLTYYHRTGPIGQVMAAWQGRPQRRRIGVVGLGAGSLAAYAAPGERWTFYEIDPVVIDIAQRRGLFTFLADARGAVDVVRGDGRRSLAAVPDGTLGILVLDAFSSDAIPAHLVTREALALYARKLAPGGLVAVHLSNRYLDLEPVVAGGAAALGFTSLVRFDRPTPAEARAGKSASHWMVMARARADLAPLAKIDGWGAPRTGTPWTDDASDLWGPLHLRPH